jgi:hypothetical protein
MILLLDAKILERSVTTGSYLPETTIFWPTRMKALKRN